MLYSIILGVIALVMPFVCVWCFIQGIKYGKTEKVPEVKKPAVSRKKKKQEQEELKRLNTLWENVSNYDGTSNNQQQIIGRK